MVQRGGLGRAEGILVPRHVIAMGVGNECPGLPPSEIDGQAGLAQFEPAIPKEHAARRKKLEETLLKTLFHRKDAEERRERKEPRMSTGKHQIMFCRSVFIRG